MKITNRNVPKKFTSVAYDPYADQSLSPDSAKHLIRSMRALDQGSAVTPTFPLYGTKDSNKVLENWLKELDSSPIPDWMKDYERSRISKFGPQGGYAPFHEVMDTFKGYVEHNSNVESTNQTNYILATMLKDFSKIRLQPVSPEEVIRNSKSKGISLDKANGWPSYNLKKDDPKAQQEALKLVKSGKWREGDSYVFERFNKQKKRIFMPAPFSSVLAQGRYYVPYIRAIQHYLDMEKIPSELQHFVSPLASKRGFDKVEQVLSHQARSFDHTKFVYLQIDFDAMDQSTGLNQYSNIVVPVYQAQFGKIYAKDIADTLLFTVTTPIIFPERGKIRKLDVPHGTASGTEVTNDGECKVNEFFQRVFMNTLEGYYKSKKKSEGYIIISRQLDGDDGLFIFALNPKDIEEFRSNVQRSLEHAAKATGVRINTSKLHLSGEYGLYLQRMIYSDSNEIIGAYPTVLALNSIMHPENYINQKNYDPDYWELRIIEILENVKHHPLHHQFIDFVVKGLKNDIFRSSDIGRFNQILSKWDNYVLARRNIKTSYTGIEADETSGILKFKTVEYLTQKYFGDRGNLG